MEILRFTVRNQRLSGGNVRLVSDTIDYIEASFDFRTEDWNGLSKWAHFTKGDTRYDLNLVDDKITKEMHLNLSAGVWEVKLHGTDPKGTTRITTDTAFVIVESYGNGENDGPLPEIPLSVAEQIDAKSQLALDTAEEAKEISGQALGIIENIEEAVANGEFDGEKGEPGKTPEIQIGKITTLPPGSDAEVTIEGTLEKPFLNFAIPQGKAGNDGVSISNITHEESNEDGGNNMVVIHLTNGTGYGWTYKNGSKGSAGRPGLEWQGEWDPEKSYWAIQDGQVSRDVVYYNGSAYVCASKSPAPVIGVVPEGDTTGKWELLVAKGEAGSTEDISTRLEEIEAEIEAFNPFKFNSAVANPNVLEIGRTISSVSVTWTLNKDPITVLVNKETATAAKNGSYTVNKNITATLNPAYTNIGISATNEKGKVINENARINFYNGIYYGAGAIPNELDTSFLTKVLSGSRARSFTATAGAGEYLWYALPTRLGEPTFKVGGFEGGFELFANAPYENDYGYTENYNIYKSVNNNLGKTTVEVS